MLIKSCIAHLYHLPGFDQVGHSALGNQWGWQLQKLAELHNTEDVLVTFQDGIL